MRVQYIRTCGSATISAGCSAAEPACCYRHLCQFSSYGTATANAYTCACDLLYSIQHVLAHCTAIIAQVRRLQTALRAKCGFGLLLIRSESSRNRWTTDALGHSVGAKLNLKFKLSVLEIEVSSTG